MSTGSYRDRGKRGHPSQPAPQPKDSGKRPVVPAVPSESAVGEEDPGDFENASIRHDDGRQEGQHRPDSPSRKAG